MPVGYGEPAMSFGIRDQHVPVAPHAYEQSNVAPARPVAVPAMPRHRDAQFTQDLAQPMSPPPAVAPTHAPAAAPAPVQSKVSVPVQNTDNDQALAEALQQASTTASRDDKFTQPAMAPTATTATRCPGTSLNPLVTRHAHCRAQVLKAMDGPSQALLTTTKRMVLAYLARCATWSARPHDHKTGVIP